MTEPEERLEDPFESHLRFAGAIGGQRFLQAVTPAELAQYQPMEDRSFDLIDPQVVEDRRTWQGSVASHRPGDPESYPQEISDAMTNCEPQFILRNLARADRWADPEEPLEFEPTEIQYGLPITPLSAALDFQPATPDLKLSLEVLVDRKRELRWLYSELPWETRFS